MMNPRVRALSAFKRDFPDQCFLASDFDFATWRVPDGAGTRSYCSCVPGCLGRRSLIGNKNRHFSLNATGSSRHFLFFV
jgi:hypothetical protein